MGLKNAAKNRMLDQLAGNTASGSPITHAGLHTGLPATTGNELTGGSPAYARKALTWEAAAGTELAGSLDLTSTYTFDVAAGSSVFGVGFWTASTAGTVMADGPAGGAGGLKPFMVDDISTDGLDAPAHGFSDGQTVIVIGTSLPTGLSEGVAYFVRDSTTNFLKLAATSGGAAIDLTAVGSGFLQRIVVETFGGQGTYQLTDADIAILL